MHNEHLNMAYCICFCGHVYRDIAGEDFWEPLGQQGDPTCPSQRKSVLKIHWKDRCWSWNSNTLATWCKELTHLKRPWCWENLKAGGEGDNRGWDGWMALPIQWTWVWVNSRSWWWTGRPGVLQSIGLQRVGHNWVTELNWTYRDVNCCFSCCQYQLFKWLKWLISMYERKLTSLMCLWLREPWELGKRKLNLRNLFKRC